MIKLFRRIRRQLLRENRMSRYLIYALGEIILVVIGILIALQINNWNELRKQNKKEYATLIDLHQEYVSNKNSFESHLQHKIDIRVRMEHLIESIANTDVLDSVEFKERGSSGAATYNPSQSVIKSVLETGMINVISNDSLRNLLTNWNDLLQDYLEDENWHLDFIHTELYEYENQNIPGHYFKTRPRDGYISPFHTTEKLAKYFNNAYNDPIYQNLLLRNHQYLDGTIKEGERVLDMMQKIIQIIEDEINTK